MMLIYIICHAKLDKSISLEDVKAFLSAEVMLPNRFHEHLLKDLANCIIVTGCVYHSMTQSSKRGIVWLCFEHILQQVVEHLIVRLHMSSFDVGTPNDQHLKHMVNDSGVVADECQFSIIY